MSNKLIRQQYAYQPINRILVNLDANGKIHCSHRDVFKNNDDRKAYQLYIVDFRGF